MRALALTSAGGLDQMEVLELPDPGAPGPDEVLVRMHAAALNRLDLFVTEGLKGVEYHFPHIVGSDGAGVVAAVGRNVTAPVIGDRVMLNGGVSCGHCRFCRRGEESLCDSFQVLGEHRAGTIADFVTLPAVNVAPVPDGMTWAQAAAYPLATLTAWRMLTTRAALAQGETLFIWGAGGGVSQACIRIGRHLGATVIVAGSTDSKLVAATELGAHHVINYRSEDIAARMKEITGRRGADVVVDSVGEATWPTTLRIVSRSGRIVVCGATTGPNLAFDARRLFWHQWTIMGSTMGNRREWMEVVAHAAAGRFWPVPDMIVPLDRAVEAYRRLQGGEQSGKVVIEVAS